ncbi:AraC family transcriptional regulator [Paenibacillus sp. FSL R5-0341]|uniref:helix-turn-helix transcriptional regulator n=1 Tax=Paenibacillus sp. FSL R5-0341 TaxID=2921636 RepID=UPI0030D5EC7D
MRQLSTQGIDTAKPDLVAQAVRYLHENYMLPIMVDPLAEILDCSAGHLSRTFKKETGSSLITYLTRIRMYKAKELLLHTDASLQKIAEAIGIPDVIYFNRLFKKHVGLSPGRFKQKCIALPTGQNNAIRESELSIVSPLLRAIQQQAVMEQTVTMLQPQKSRNPPNQQYRNVLLNILGEKRSSKVILSILFRCSRLQRTIC